MRDNNVVNVVIEIPKNSNIKYEYNRSNGHISVDRILYGSSVYPENYGFIREALDWDGDELDVLVIADQSFMPGIEIPTRILGAMPMVDSGETDTKLIGVIDCDPRFKTYKSLDDLPNHKLKVIRDFFETYKRLQEKEVKVYKPKDCQWAINELNECKKLMIKYGKMPKEEFLTKMKKEHPEKYKEHPEEYYY